MVRYRMEWIERVPNWCHVEADDPTEAKIKLLDGDVIEGTQDSDPGSMDRRTITTELVEDTPEITFR